MSWIDVAPKPLELKQCVAARISASSVECSFPGLPLTGCIFVFATSAAPVRRFRAPRFVHCRVAPSIAEILPGHSLVARPFEPTPREHLDDRATLPLLSHFDQSIS